MRYNKSVKIISIWVWAGLEVGKKISFNMHEEQILLLIFFFRLYTKTVEMRYVLQKSIENWGCLDEFQA